MVTQWQFNLNWRISIFSAICLVVFFNLSHWQIERAEEKRILQSKYEQQRSAMPKPPELVNFELADLAGVNLQLEGQFDNSHTFLLDNRVLQGKVGFEVVSPFRLTNDSNWDLVLVNRGWLEMGATRDEAIDVPPIDDPEVVFGWIYLPDGEMFSLGSEPPAGTWPRFIQNLNTSEMIAQLDSAQRVLPFIVRLDEASAGALPRHWPIVNMRPEKHTGYAVQWFMMAVAVLIAYFWVSVKRVPQESQTYD